ncbi:MAG: hypothetical protein GXX09_02460 [Syntrophomonadaceae bacterium]|nr:hypothetical protein [Syntrophomonadaceae bacterium]
MSQDCEQAVSLTLLKAILEEGGKVSSSKGMTLISRLCPRVASQLGKDWNKRVRLVVEELKRKGYMSRQSPRGIWEITWEGRKLLESVLAGREQADNILGKQESPRGCSFGSTSDRNEEPECEFSNDEATEQSVQSGDIKQVLVRFGEMCKRETAADFRFDHYAYDVVWFLPAEKGFPSRVFKIDLNGEYMESLLALERIAGSMSSKPVLIVSGRHERLIVQNLIESMSYWMFPHLAQRLTVWTRQELLSTVQSLEREINMGNIEVL